MQKNKYDSIRYIGQELHLALKRLFVKGQYGDIKINHRDDETLGETMISYSVYGLEVRMLVSKTDKGFHLNAQVGVKDSEHLETKCDTDLKIRRSKNGRVSQDRMDNLALQSIGYLREFHKNRKSREAEQS